MSTVCSSLFTLPLGVIGRLYFVIMTLPGHRLCYYFNCAHISSQILLDDANYLFSGPSCSKLTMSLVNVSLKR